jgi:hypothetical protein
VYQVDFNFKNEVSKQIMGLVRSLGADAEVVECRVSTQRCDLTRTLWIVVPVTIDGSGLLDRVGECVEKALDMMARVDDDDL